MPERHRKQSQGITLFSDADAVAMGERERERQLSQKHSLNSCSNASGLYNSAFVSRTSSTMFTKDRDSMGDSYSIDTGTDTGLIPSMGQRISVSPEVSHTFEELFETDWEGYIWKQGHVVRSWRYRYAVLSGTCFSYYSSKEIAMADTERYRGRVTVTGAERDGSRTNGVLIRTTVNKVFSIQTSSTIESDLWIRMISQAVANSTGLKTSLTTGSLLAQTVRSSGDLKTRNMNVTKQFYACWSTLYADVTSSNGFLALFPLCSTDIALTLRYPCEFLSSCVFYGREGIVDVVLGLYKHVQFRNFTVSRCLTTKQPNTLQVIASGRIWNKNLRREFVFNTRDEIEISPGGRVVSMFMQIEVDFNAFKVADSIKKSPKLDRQQQASASKRVLSLSIQHFHVNRVLGKGTFGTVVLAARKNTGQIFAVKVLEKDSMSSYDKLRTKTEMRILRDVHHPFIAPLRFAFQSNSRVFLGMEYYPGGSLYTHMNRFSNNKEHRIKIPLELSRVRFYAAQIVLALCHLHACDIVYRDLKPDNIMLDEFGNVALVDFGLSKTSVSLLTGARTMAGSPAYTAPELLKPKRTRDYGKAVDWWCLGILIYEMLLAKRPFHHLNVSVLYKLIEKDPVKFPAKCTMPSDACDLIMGLLEKDPTKRLGARQTSEILTHPFFRDIKWDWILKKKVQPPWVPTPISLEHERSRSASMNFDKYLASRADPSGNIFNMLLSWKTSRTTRARRNTTNATSDNDFGKFSYVSDTTNSFLVDEDDILDSAFTGRRSVQVQALSNEM
uniref:Protein kinase putative n=1 Tax=Albugo laibachii Nc14 TaxID=890382 RepID=F0WKB1_9STRA|nr:protein kinase putative [Albugo laibachii Nc14]CCA21860.1 protein kinase putative [Albugo laibachii Nc14]|eukprot:CCA21860.1 protein kinase putative [Albugo laibachii Nc14]